MLVAVAVLATGLRFFRTGSTPPGFYRDEAAIAAQVICLAESGRTLEGARWPLMDPEIAAGYSTIVWQMPAATWTRVAGYSIAGVRSFAALCGALAVVGVFFFGWFATANRRIGVYSAVAAAISPWAFQFSRVAWDAAIAPCYVAWALACLCLATTPRANELPWQRWLALVSSALLFAAACIAYPPLRVQVPLVMLAFAIWKRSQVRSHLRQTVTFSGVFAIATSKLWLLTLSGDIQQRFDNMSVFSGSVWAARGIVGRGPILLNGLWLFLKNLFSHLSPAYLFISGDANLRHSTQLVGEWSWLDALAIVAALGLAAKKRTRPTGWVVFAMCGYLAAAAAASLTIEGIPHALRSIGGIPFLAVIVGTSLDTVAAAFRKGMFLVPVGTTVVAFASFAFFLGGFFGPYTDAASDHFDGKMVDQLTRPAYLRQVVNADREGWLDVDDPGAYPLRAIRYYELSAGEMECSRHSNRLFAYH